MTEVHKDTATAIGGDTSALAMARTLSRGLLVLLAVLPLLSRLTNASGVYQGPRGQKPSGSSGKRPLGFGVPSGKQPPSLIELQEKQRPVPEKSSVKQPLVSDVSLIMQSQGPEGSDLAGGPFPELIPVQPGSSVGQSPDTVTKPPSEQPSGPITKPPDEQTLDAENNGQNLDQTPPHSEQLTDAGCVGTPTEPQPCAGFEGPRQSPINIDPCSGQLTVDRSPLKFSNPDAAPASMLLTNTGNRVMGVVTWGNTPPATVSGGGLPGTFVYEIFDIHWGANSSYGSEHTVNGLRYAAELHIGLRNIKYKTLDEALLHVDGSAGFAVFFDKKSVSGQRGIAPLAESLFQIKEAYSTSEVASPPSLKQLLPLRLDRYVRYTGSPTALAPCWGTVTWIVLLEPIGILDIELQLLRGLRNENGDRLCESTIRPLQYVGGRKMYTKQRFVRCLFKS